MSASQRQLRYERVMDLVRSIVAERALGPGDLLLQAASAEWPPGRPA